MARWARLKIERFQQIIESALADGPNGGRQIAERSHDDDRHAAQQIAEMLHGGESIHARQADIEHDGVGPIRLAPLPSPARPKPPIAAVCPIDSASFVSPQQMLCSSSTINRVGHGGSLVVI